MNKTALRKECRASSALSVVPNLIQTIDRRNLSASMTYNKSDMVVVKTTIDSVRGNTVIATTYTQFGPAKIAQSEGASAIVENDYWYHWSGGVLKQQQIIDTYTMQIDNTFDAAGNQITTKPTGSGATPLTNTFNIVPQFHAATPDTDNFNRVAIVDNSTSKNVITYEPDFLGLATSIKYGDYASLIGKMSYTYNKFLQPATLKSNETTKFLDITLTRGFPGNIVRRQQPALSPAPAIDYSYTYDGMNRILSGESETETYDELSNLITKGTGKYVYQDKDQANGDQMRLASFTTGTQYNYTYDANGNPTIISNKFTSLAYDNLNLLRQIVYAQTDRYWYNTSGLRVKKTENATGTWKTTYTLFDGDNPLMQEVYTSTGRIQVTFNIIVNGKILAQYKRVYPSTTTTVYFYLDHLNSRRVVVNSSKAVIDRYRYSAWGVVTQDVGSDDYRSFTGKDYNATGLIYFNARYYDPTTGRFVTEDPSRNRGNWYMYCENDPVNNVDPRGLFGYHTGPADWSEENYNKYFLQGGKYFSLMFYTGELIRANLPLVAKAFGVTDVSAATVEEAARKAFSNSKFLESIKIVRYGLESTYPAAAGTKLVPKITGITTIGKIAEAAKPGLTFIARMAAFASIGADVAEFLYSGKEPIDVANLVTNVGTTIISIFDPVVGISLYLTKNVLFSREMFEMTQKYPFDFYWYTKSAMSGTFWF